MKSLPKAEYEAFIHPERLVTSSLEKRLLLVLEGSIVSMGMLPPVDMLGRTNMFIVISLRPSNKSASVIDSKTTRISIKLVMLLHLLLLLFSHFRCKNGSLCRYDY
jgi:hypothetical protein